MPNCLHVFAGTWTDVVMECEELVPVFSDRKWGTYTLLSQSMLGYIKSYLFLRFQQLLTKLCVW